jgi:hypothetical protein
MALTLRKNETSDDAVYCVDGCLAVAVAVVGVYFDHSLGLGN